MSIEKVRDYFRPLGVPTVLWPGSRWGAMDFQAASSIRAHMKGVPNTGSAPEQAA